MSNTLRRLIRPLRLLASCIKGYLTTSRIIRESDKICWLIGTPDHKNLGDHAIAYASILFIEKALPDYKIYEISEDDFYGKFLHLKSILNPSDIIVLQGGGNLGNQYQYIEDIRRIVINSCKNNPIILFPQTVHFTSSREGTIEEQYTKKIYNRNKNLQIFAREATSRQIMEKLFDSKHIGCTPDIALALCGSELFLSKYSREGILCCFRDDIEGIFSSAEKEYFFKQLCQFGTVTKADTVLDHMVSVEERENELRKIWDTFSRSKLVITDRLHGMVFAAITNTPCIVFSNYNHKVAGVFDWIKKIGFIHFVQNKTDFSLSLVMNIINAEINESELVHLHSQFIALENALHEAAKKQEEIT